LNWIAAIAALEHLLPLKLEAFIDRRGSAKGDKDAKDILRLACVAHAQPGGLKAEVAAAYMDERHMGLLADIQRGPYAMAMALGNAKKAKELRTIFADFVLKLAAATSESDPKPSRQRG
jgi:hypothetical protein